jgi:hypothetical protein
MRNENNATVTIPGATIRADTRHIAPKSEQPSTSAASSSSRGTDSKLLRIMKMPNGSWNMTSTRARPISVFCMPSLPSRM